MASSWLMRAAAAVGLGAVAAPVEVQRLGQQDASALVQVNAEFRPGGPLAPMREKRQMEFPLYQEEKGLAGYYAGSASFNIDVMGWHVHCYDIALYIRSNSSLWSSEIRETREEKLDELLDNAFFEMVAHSKWVSNTNMASFVDRLEFFAKKLKVASYARSLHEYKEVYLNGPTVTRGSHILLFPSRQGIHPFITGKDMGLVKSDFLGRVLIQAYFGMDSDLPEFRDQVFAQLNSGQPREVGQPAEVHTQAGDPATNIIIVVVIVVVAVCCFFGGVWCCCCRRQKAIPADEETLNGAAKSKSMETSNGAAKSEST